MEFVHQAYQPEETIAAIATPPGEGGVAIIRISGKEALKVAERVFSGPVRNYKSHTVHYGKVINPEGESIDSALLIPMLGERSYTGENTIEIHCHGGSLLSRKVLEVVLQAGARAARPGEFTFRAFMNGKIDLAQAEAVQELICAKNEKAIGAARNQLEGKISRTISDFQARLTTIAAILEAWVDFPEEGLEFASFEQLYQDLEKICLEMQQLEATYHDGRILQEGISLCLIGSPNVGKSSLMNAILDKDRAIVSPIPGTTRDVLEDHFRLNGLNLRIMDTAGIRKTEEAIEQEGIRRSREAMNQADLILFVLDVTQKLEEETLWLASQVPQAKTIAIWNKIDLDHEPIPFLNFPHHISVSAKQKIGLEELKRKIDQVIWKDGPPSNEESLITNARHKEALNQSILGCQKVLDGLKSSLSPEFLSIDIRHSLVELGQIIGTNITEDILSAIFSKFCIGK